VERLSKVVARVSEFSRRKSEKIIRAGKVKVNKVVVYEPYRQVEAGDIVSINNQIMEAESIKLYIALYKPEGYMSDLQDPRGRKTARDLIKLDVKLYPVGRLDYHSEGLMLFTNDGDFANEIMHPRYEIEKEYLVKFKGLLNRDEINRIKKGVHVDDSKREYGESAKDYREKRQPLMDIRRNKQKKDSRAIYKLNEIQLVRTATKNGWYRVTVTEGKNRMIRKIGEAIDHPVLKLKRIRIGKLQLGDLQSGEYRYFEKAEALDTRNKGNRIKNI